MIKCTAGLCGIQEQDGLFEFCVADLVARSATFVPTHSGQDHGGKGMVAMAYIRKPQSTGAVPHAESE
jgi:hypothetical protein